MSADAVGIGMARGRDRHDGRPRPGDKPGMAHDVDADVVGRQVAGILQEPADAAADVDEHAARMPGAQECRGGAINRDVALALTRQSTFDGCVDLSCLPVSASCSVCPVQASRARARSEAGRPRVPARRGVRRPPGAQPRAQPRVVDELAEHPRQRVEVSGRHEPTALVRTQSQGRRPCRSSRPARPTGALRQTRRRTARAPRSADRRDRPRASAAARHAARREIARAARVRARATSCRRSAR